MTTFAIAAAILLVLAIAVLLLPLLRGGAAGGEVEREDANLRILRDQFNELENDLRNGTISSEQYDNARAELERRVLEESRRTDPAMAGISPRRTWLLPVVIALLLPVAAVALYAHLGNRDGFDVQAYMQQQAADLTPQRVQEMTQKLVQHLEDNPNDVEAWGMLGRAYQALHQFDESARAWGRAAALAPADADVLVEYAEALVLAAGGEFTEEPTRVLARSLQLMPNNTKALAMSGGGAFRRGDYRAAIEHWQKLLALSGDDEELAQALEGGIAEARARLGERSVPSAVDARPATVTGSVSLSPQLSAAAASDDVVFIFARAAEGPGMPLAVTRVKVSDLPFDFRLDDSMSVMPGKKMSDVQRVVVGARISKSGGAMRASGDLEGYSAATAVDASGVRVVIDRRVP